MDNYSRIDEFLKYLARIIEAGGEILSAKDIHSLLSKYDVSDENIDFDGNPDIVNGEIDESSLFYKIQEALRDDEKISGYNDGYWFHLKSREKYIERDDDYIKMYIPLDADHIEYGVGRIMGFLAYEGIYHESSVGKYIRVDDLVVRLTSSKDAYRLAEFIKNDSYIQDGLIKASPFAIEKDGIAYACDGSMSYHSVVASLIKLYIEEEKGNIVISPDGAKFDLSFEGFRSFVTNYYNDLVLHPEKRDNLENDFFHDEEFNVRDCMHIIELICHSMDPNFNYDDYLEFYRNNIYNYNRKYELLSMPTAVDINNMNDSHLFKTFLHIPSYNEKEKLELDLVRLEVMRGMRIKELEELDLLIANKQGQLNAYQDVELFDFDDKVVVSYLNVPALLESIKLIKKNVYADENGFVYEPGVVIDDTVDLTGPLSTTLPLIELDDVSTLSDEIAEELLHRCDRYKQLTNWRQIIEIDMKEKNISSLQELLEFIRMEKPEEYKLAKSSYENELVRKRFSQLNIPVDSEDFQPDFENRNMIDVKCIIPYFECGVEQTVCPGDIELKIKIGHDYDESVDGPLYSGKLDFEADEVVSVEGLFTNKEVYANANISFQANIPNYVSGTSYCVRDEETGVIFKFEYNLVKRKVLERDYSEPKGVGREELYVMRMAELMPWTKETSKKETEFNGINEFAVAIPSEKDAAKIDAEEEKIARDKLKHCKLFSSYAEKDGVIDSIISDPNNSVTNARDMVNVIREKEPVIYSEMEAAYAASKKDSVQPVVSMSHR